jgi:F-type H+-transporting ATPase subunit gamma
MNSRRELRRRIKSVSSMAQITRAMQMVAASKMRAAQQAALAPRPFALLMYRIQRAATTRPIDFTHPLLERRQVRRRAIILVAADKGLCGALNTNVFRLAAPFDPETTLFITAGRKAAQWVTRSGRRLAAEFAYGDAPSFAEARAIANCARELFLKGDVDEVRLLATRFLNTLTQEALVVPFIPIGEITGLKVPGMDVPIWADAAVHTLFEPNARSVLAYLLGHYLNASVYLTILNAKASEHSARMVAMKNATDSAEELVRSLRLAYNRLRQGNITRELIDIAGGQVG